MNKPAPVSEPSMEEILASIRRIIADEAGAVSRFEQDMLDEQAASRQQGGEIPLYEESPARQEAIRDEAGLPPVKDRGLGFEGEAQKKSAPAAPDADITGPKPLQEQGAEYLVGEEAAEAVSSSFAGLSQIPASGSGQARTLEELVSDMLRPMLKTWLDENLPQLVQKLVSDEIERLTRKR